MALKSVCTLLPFESTFSHCAHRAPRPSPWLPQPAHDRHVCFKDLPSSQPSGQLLHPDLQSVDKGGLELKCLTLCSLFATSSTLMPFQAHHLLHPPPSPTLPGLLTKLLGALSFKLPSCKPPRAHCPAPWLCTCLLTLPGFLGSP